MEPRRVDCLYISADGAAVVISDQGHFAILAEIPDSSVLNRALILVAEDEAVIAMDVAMAVRDAGGEVAGPVASVKQAIALIDTLPIVAAILDVNLTDGDVSPVVEILVAAGIPIILQSGLGLPPELAARFPRLTVLIKPCIATDLVTQLASLISNGQTDMANGMVT